jgi:hypothetical protein
MYDEAPRIRHQLAELLVRFDHTVIFYQKPIYPFSRGGQLLNKVVSNQVEIRQTKQLIHHQMRLFYCLAQINAIYESHQISRSLFNLSDNDIVINFNYDYYFLRNLFPNNKIITVINDDFIAQARFFKGKHVQKSLEKVCSFSNAVLTVSYPLLKQVSQWTDKAFLFLPWTKNEYKSPNSSTNRNALLLWAHIDKRVDLDLLVYIFENRKNYEIHIVGPISDDLNEKIQSLKLNYKNLLIFPSTSLDKLNTDHYFCSIIPYKSKVADIEAVTASNKTFQLMSQGLPLVTFGMPYFLEHKAIFKAESYQDFCQKLDISYHKFSLLQRDIEELVTLNQSFQRYSQLIDIISKG